MSLRGTTTRCWASREMRTARDQACLPRPGPGVASRCCRRPRCRSQVPRIGRGLCGPLQARGPVALRPVRLPGARQPGLRRRALGRRPTAAARGENVHIAIELRNFEAVEGTRRVVHYEAAVRCEACWGRGSLGLPDPECDACGGSGRKRTVSHLDVANLLQIEPCPACVGEACSQCGGDGIVSAERRIRLVVPPGVQDGAQLRVGGDGNDAGAGRSRATCWYGSTSCRRRATRALFVTRRSCSCSWPWRRSCCTSSARG